MKRRMFFKLGVSLIILIGILLFYVVDVEQERHRYHLRKTITGIEQYQLIFKKEHDNILMKETVAEIKAFETIEEDDFREDFNNLIDEQQKEIVNLNHIKFGVNDLSSSSEKVSDTFSLGGMEQNLKNDDGNDNSDSRSMPDNKDKLNQNQNKKESLFNAKDQRPVISRSFVSNQNSPPVHLSIVVCENRAEEALQVLKSAALMSEDVSLAFHIVADEENQRVLQAKLDSWPLFIRQRIAYFIYDVAFPQGRVTLNAWSKLYKPCASQRLFLPDRLTSLDSLIYVDTDSIFLRSAGALWSVFRRFNESQMVGLVQESEDGVAGWYNRFANHPFYGQFGVNSGVMMMNLTRLRQSSQWLSVLQDAYEKYHLSMTWGDQDLINIFLSTRPEQVYVLPCDWNYRSDHCMYMSTCKSAEQAGVSLLHASRGSFHNGKEPVFTAIYQAFLKFEFGLQSASSFVSDLERRLKQAKGVVSLSSCKDVTHLILSSLSAQFGGTNQDKSSTIQHNQHQQNKFKPKSKSHQASPNAVHQVISAENVLVNDIHRLNTNIGAAKPLPNADNKRFLSRQFRSGAVVVDNVPDHNNNNNNGRPDGVNESPDFAVSPQHVDYESGETEGVPRLSKRSNIDNNNNNNNNDINNKRKMSRIGRKIRSMPRLSLVNKR